MFQLAPIALVPLRIFWDAAAIIQQINAAGVWSINQIQIHLIIPLPTLLRLTHKASIIDCAKFMNFKYNI